MNLMKIAKPSSSRQVPVKLNLNWDGLYNHSETHPPTRPTHPGQVYLSHFYTTLGAKIWYGSFIQQNYFNYLTS